MAAAVNNLATIINKLPSILKIADFDIRYYQGRKQIMKSQKITNRIISSMIEDPDKWKLYRKRVRLWASHSAGIDVACEGGYWVDISERGRPELGTRGAPASLSWWDQLKIRKATKQLIREKLHRLIDRNELFNEGVV